MSDMIERSAAIDALEKVSGLFPWRVPGNRDSYDRYNEAWNDAIGRAEIEIEELPSAQPEKRTENARKRTHACDLEAELVNVGDKTSKSYWAEQAAYLPASVLPPAQPEKQWIPVTERLPNHELALVQYSDGDFDLLQFPTAYRRKDIVAWMPLPAPYEERREE